MESEHAAVPQAEVVAPVATPAVGGGAAPAGTLAGPMTPARVLAMQRSAGNQAVTALLQRQETETKEKSPVTGRATSAFPAASRRCRARLPRSPAAPTSCARRRPTSSTSPPGSGCRRARSWAAPRTSASCRTSSPRRAGAVWRRGGDPAGEITANSREGRSKAYDAVSDPNDDTKINKRVFPPFYWPPSSINDENVAASPAETDPAAHDQPGFSEPVKKEGGRLTEFVGSDHFKLGVAVKKGDSVRPLRAFDWSVPCAMDVDSNFNGAGKALQSAEVKDLLRDGPDTSLGEKPTGCPTGSTRPSSTTRPPTRTSSRRSTPRRRASRSTSPATPRT